MDAPRHESADALDEPYASRLDRLVTCHTTRPGRAVFTERNNTDGWIATDLIVALER